MAHSGLKMAAWTKAGKPADCCTLCCCWWLGVWLLLEAPVPNQKAAHREAEYREAGCGAHHREAGFEEEQGNQEADSREWCAHACDGYQLPSRLLHLVGLACQVNWKDMILILGILWFK